MAAGTIAAYAFGFNLIEMTKKAYSQLVEKETYEEGDHELIITSDCKENDSFPEFLEKEKVDALLLPYDLSYDNLKNLLLTFLLMNLIIHMMK